MYKKIALSTALLLCLLSGCFGPKPEEEVYAVFEDAVKQEKNLFEEAKALTALEQKNAQLYDSILQGGQEDSDQVKGTVEQALQGLKERTNILAKEQTALEKARSKMKEADQHIRKIEDKKLRKQAEKVVSLYEERFTAFVHMHEAYGKALASEEKLYGMLQTKTEKLKTITDQVQEVNGLYADMRTNNEAFNQLTQQYNQEKVRFYKQANFRIEEKIK
ncbi:YkyA family protein [Ectobacillus funiculus]|uniref:YkyA family protein n=1 Tax=Ectobacillus funiculus TaxID=137993 RepID=UPI0013EA45F9|nr:YkyA family protein [Ectobacillus funiculus]